MKFRKRVCTTVLAMMTLAPCALAGTWYVDGVHGSDNNNCKSPQTACKTIGHAISLASSGDSVMVAPATYTENLTISFDLKLIGTGASTTIIDGGGANTVVTIPASSSHVSFSKVTIRNGSAHNSTAHNGGGVLNSGALSIDNSILSGNLAKYCIPFKKCDAAEGGGIYNSGLLTVKDTTLSGNSATLGGAIYTTGRTLTINNSTLSGNNAGPFGGGGGGGGLYATGGALTISNSTISGNSAYVAGGGIINGGALKINYSTLSGNNAVVRWRQFRRRHSQQRHVDD